jgi:hypothetical protein
MNGGRNRRNDGSIEGMMEEWIEGGLPGGEYAGKFLLTADKCTEEVVTNV